MNDRGSCKHGGKIHKNETEKEERKKRWASVWTLKLAHSGNFWLTSLDRKQQEGERNTELRRRGEENKEKWCNVFHLFILVATQRLEAAWLKRTSKHWQPEAAWASGWLHRHTRHLFSECANYVYSTELLILQSRGTTEYTEVASVKWRFVFLWKVNYINFSRKFCRACEVIIQYCVLVGHTYRPVTFVGVAQWKRMLKCLVPWHKSEISLKRYFINKFTQFSFFFFFVKVSEERRNEIRFKSLVPNVKSSRCKRYFSRILIHMWRL